MVYFNYMLILRFFFGGGEFQGRVATPSRPSHTASQDDHVSKANAGALPSSEVCCYSFGNMKYVSSLSYVGHLEGSQTIKHSKAWRD